MLENESNKDKSNDENSPKNNLSNNERNNNDENIKINLSIFQSQLSPDNPILIQLIEFGYNSIYSRRIIQYFHPLNIEDALEYLSIQNGIIQHHFIQDRDINNINICYACGELKENHLDYINNNNVNSYFIKKSTVSSINNDLNNVNNNISENRENKDNNNKSAIINKNDDNKSNINNSNSEPIKLENLYFKISNQLMCPVCSDPVIPTNENIIKNCGHSFCNNCWYDFLSIKIKENKLNSIKCLDYECKEKLNDEFILKLIDKNDELIKKYKNYKLELEIINDPNKKLCPFPNCNSYLELKDINNKDVTCFNKHTFCFLCLQNPHGKLACKGNLNKSIIEFAKNHFLKKCPNCSIITEKSSGCNHIICSKCNYQWCWLCNEKYSYDHYLQGKCKGFQFFKPNDEYDIKLAFEGKINLEKVKDKKIYFMMIFIMMK